MRLPKHLYWRIHETSHRLKNERRAYRKPSGRAIHDAFRRAHPILANTGRPNSFRADVGRGLNVLAGRLILETAVGRVKMSIHCVGQALDLQGETKNAVVTSLVIRQFFAKFK